MRACISAKLLSWSGKDGRLTPATRPAPQACVQTCRTCRSSGNMSGNSRRFSTTAVSHFWAVACSSAFFSTVLRPPSNCRHTGTKPLYIVIAMGRTPVRLRQIAGDLSPCHRRDKRDKDAATAYAAVPCALRAGEEQASMFVEEMPNGILSDDL